MIRKYWWAVLVVVVLVYLFKPGWLKFKNSPGVAGGPIGGPLANMAGYGTMVGAAGTSQGDG